MIRAAVVVLAVLVAGRDAAVAPPLPTSSAAPALPTASSPSRLPSSPLPSGAVSKPTSVPPLSPSQPSLPPSQPSLSPSSSSKPSLLPSSNPSLSSVSNPSLPSPSNPSLPTSSNPSLSSTSSPLSKPAPSAKPPPPPSSSKPTPAPQGNMFPCSDAEKVCFRHDRVFYTPHKKCYRAGTQGPCEGANTFVVLRDPKTGRYEGQCRAMYMCSEHYRSLSRDGPCFKATPSKTDKEWLTCPSDPTKFLQRNNFDDESACCEPEACRKPREPVVQPDKPGVCVPPKVKVYSLLDYYPLVKNVLREKINIPCDKDEQKCFEQKKLFLNGRCWRPLAPCGGGTSWVIVDRAAFEKDSRLKATCVKSRCAPGRVFFEEEHRCRSVWELQSVLCAGDEIVFDLFGAAHCGRGVSQASLLVLPELPAASTTPRTPSSTTPPNLRSSVSRRSTTTPRTPGLSGSSGSLDVCTWPSIAADGYGGTFGSGVAVPSRGSDNSGKPGITTHGAQPGV